MDAYTEYTTYDNADGLSYDDTTTYEEQVAQIPVEPTNSMLDGALGGGGLASRISSNKAYLAPDSAASVKRYKFEKRKREEEYELVEEDLDMEEADDGVLRQNALFIKGTPISHLPTGRIFAYARHFETKPVALEWIDDTSCILVFPSISAGRTAYEALLQSASEDVDEDGLVVAKSLPVTLWPPEDRINKTLGMSEGLKGTIRMRFARKDDVKKRGARNNSEFYRKHGMDAGKDPNTLVLGRNLEGDRKRRRAEASEMDDEDKRKMLDDELDAFLARDDDEELSPDIQTSLQRRLTSPEPVSKMRSDALANGSRSRSPPSKMRSDYIDNRGRSLLERTSFMRAHPDDLELEGNMRVREWDSNRNRERNPRRRGGRQRGGEQREERPTHPLPRTRGERPRKTQEELDAELDAFLNDRD